MSLSEKAPALLSKAPTLIRYANHMDYLLAAVCLGLGVWLESPWWFAGAAVSLVCAIVNPTQRLHEALMKRLMRRPASTKSG